MRPCSRAATLAAALAAAALVGVAAPGRAAAPATLADHAVVLARSPDGLAWRRGATLLEHASVPDLIVSARGRLRVYYVDASRSPSTLECAEVVRGRPRVLGCRIAGQPTALALDPSVVRISRGRYRLFYYSAGETGIGSDDAHTIRSAVSRDGVRFRDEGVAFSYPGLVDPDVFRVAKRRWLMLVHSSAAGHTIAAASRNGRGFRYAGSLSPRGWGTAGPVALGRGRLRLYAFRQGEQRSFSSFRSRDGLRWAQEPGVRLSALVGEEITDPQVVRHKGAWRMAFKTSPRP